MITKRIFMGLAIACFWSSAFAGDEDWSGKFTIRNATGNIQTVTHEPTYIEYLFFHIGQCLFLRKGSSINDIVTEVDTELCTHARVEKFTGEVQKLGSILNKSITLGPTY